jgi:hypothetical protein
MSSRGAVQEGARRAASSEAFRSAHGGKPARRTVFGAGTPGKWALVAWLAPCPLVAWLAPCPLVALLAPCPLVAQPQRWLARGNGLEFRFDAERKATVAMVTDNGQFPRAMGKVHFDNGLARRATLSGLGDGPARDVGLHRNGKIVDVFRKDPDTGVKEDAVFCATDVRVE